jgi:TM2 domain-containing membrane protein YozV
MLDAFVSQSSTTNDTKAILQYQANAKSVGLAFAFWFFFGMVGAHRFYSGKPGSGGVQLLLTLVSIPLCLVLVGFLTFFANAMWVFLDVFFISGWVREYNSKLANWVSR